MIYGSGDHGIRIAFHCAPECEIEKESNSMVMVRAGSTIVRMAFDDRLEMTPHRADQAGGWYSPRYGIKVATYTLFASAQLTLPVTLTTTIEVLNER
jgi:hypothetical protein